MTKSQLMQAFYLGGVTVAGFLSLAGADMKAVMVVSYLTIAVLNIVLGGEEIEE